MICEQFSEIETTCRNSIERHLIDTVHFRQLCEYETIVILIPIYYLSARYRQYWYIVKHFIDVQTYSLAIILEKRKGEFIKIVKKVEKKTS